MDGGVYVLCFKNSQYNSIEASLEPRIDQLYSTNRWPGVHKAWAVVQLGLSHNRSVLRISMRVPDSCSISLVVVY